METVLLMETRLISRGKYVGCAGYIQGTPVNLSFVLDPNGGASHSTAPLTPRWETAIRLKGIASLSHTQVLPLPCLS